MDAAVALVTAGLQDQGMTVLHVDVRPIGRSDGRSATVEVAATMTGSHGRPHHTVYEIDLRHDGGRWTPIGYREQP